MIDVDRLRKALDEWDHGEVRLAAEWLVELADEGAELWAEKPCEHGRTTGEHEVWPPGEPWHVYDCPGGSRVRVWPQEDR